ncbi:MAG: hypothetical protein NTV05_00060 [Acidobacteria bacterium]|nr:hypothetical protein [Acidobacteriota bacterium]
MKRVPGWTCRSRQRSRIGTGSFFGWRRRLGAKLLAATFLATAVHAQSPKQLWVLQGPDQIVEYDAITFASRRTLTVPRRLIEHPEYLSINATGQMLFLPLEGVQWGGGEMATAADRVWFWDGRQAREWKLEGPKTSGVSAGTPTVTETTRRWCLSARGEALYWFENRFEKITNGLGLERSVRSAARVWRTNLAGDGPETIATLASAGWCQCTTGTCSESCPEWSFWAPDGVVDDFFLVTRMTPGQIGSSYHESVLYQRSGRTWRGTKLPEPVERPLAGSPNGGVLVAAVPDGGCCGWENESNDQTLFLRNRKASVLYDETRRYDNRNYDVSFFTADARLTVGNGMLAHTIVSTARSGGDIRLSLDGKANPEELARMRTAIAELPAVEILQLGDPPRSTVIIHQAELVGWLSDRELLLAQNGRLVVYDSRGNRVKETSIRVRTAADAFLR